MTRGKAQGLRVAGDPEQVSESQWLQLISLRESEHPADVLGPLSRLIELGVEQAGDKYRYAKAVKALRRLREDYERAGDAADPRRGPAGLQWRRPLSCQLCDHLPG